ncbi:hypothetical protein BV22DRAFT_145772 [Leucogyrophana mollusca]|uniref:Uncharacterized protein n=1 Tax=Leucogyrophana mollusca TaxID=85980 RepID=A0ACB8BT95_9AGAM|nr:hypothetical protein BV22DRAFT_145772 [Leucogyrophana mollusca]
MTIMYTRISSSMLPTNCIMLHVSVYALFSSSCSSPLCIAVFRCICNNIITSTSHMEPSMNQT